jgi:hypothetical protein
MPYYVTPAQTITTRSGNARTTPVLPIGVQNWAGTLLDDGRYLIWARATVDVSLQVGISILTAREAAALAPSLSDGDLAKWSVP